jgi:FixJ family two-component response regulator
VPPATTIFIIDADAAFVHTVSALGKSMGLEICWFSSGEEFFRQFDSERPGCLVLEVRLSDMSGLDVQQRLKAMPISPPIIFVVAKADVPTVVRAKRMGAVNFMLKQSISETELWESIRTAIERDAADRAVHEHRRSQLERLSRLTGPERQVLDLLLSGNSNRHIAEVLGVTRRAAESRRARLMRKLGANSLPDLVRFGIDAGLFGAVEGEPEA